MAWLPLYKKTAGAEAWTWAVNGGESCNPALTIIVAGPEVVPYGSRKLICVALAYCTGAGWPLTVTETSASTGRNGLCWAAIGNPARFSPYILAYSSGASGPGCEFARLTTALICGVLKVFKNGLNSSMPGCTVVAFWNKLNASMSGGGDSSPGTPG